MRRALLIVEEGEDAEVKANYMLDAGFDATVVDPFHLHWPKMVAGGGWDAIIVELEALSEIAVELAAEICVMPVSSQVRIILLGEAELALEELPTPLRSTVMVADYQGLIKELQKRNSR